MKKCYRRHTAATQVSAAAETLSLSPIGDCTIGDQYKYRGYKSGFTYKISKAGLIIPFPWRRIFLPRTT